MADEAAQKVLEPNDEFRKLGMTERQLVQAVRQGRKVTLLIIDYDPVSGYLGGWDDERWMVVSPDDGGVRVHLILKSATVDVHIHEDGSYRQEPHSDDIYRRAGAFWTKIRNDYFTLVEFSESRASKRRAG